MEEPIPNSMIKEKTMSLLISYYDFFILCCRTVLVNAGQAVKNIRWDLVRNKRITMCSIAPRYHL